MSANHPTTPGLIPAVGYLRRSTDKQEASIEDQRTWVSRWAQENGYIIIRWYEDDAVSGDDTKHRFGFQKMVRDAQEKRDFRLIICWDKKRFGRFDMIEAGYWIHPLREAGVHLATVVDGMVDWDSYGGKLTGAIEQEGHHRELVKLSEDVLRGMIRTALEGNWPGGRAPFGYRIVEKPDRPSGAKRWPKKLVPGDPAKIEVVRWLFRTYAYQDVTLSWLAQELTNRGVLTPTGKTVWNPGSVWFILQRATYLGDITYGDLKRGKYHRANGTSRMEVERGALKSRARSQSEFLLVKGAHQALLVNDQGEPDRETWQRVQAKLKENADRHTPTQNFGDWLLSDLLVCGHCHGALYGQIKKDTRKRKTDRRRGPAREPVRQYVCSTYQHAMGCHYHHLPEADALRGIVAALERDYLNLEKLEQVRTEYRAKVLAEHAAGAAAAQDLQKQKAALEEDIARGRMAALRAPEEEQPEAWALIAVWKQEKAAIERRLAELDRGPQLEAIDALVAHMEKYLWRLRDALQKGEPAAIRAVLRELIVKAELFWECGPDAKHRHCKFVLGKVTPRLDEFTTVENGCRTLEESLR